MNSKELESFLLFFVFIFLYYFTFLSQTNTLIPLYAYTLLHKPLVVQSIFFHKYKYISFFFLHQTQAATTLQQFVGHLVSLCLCECALTKGFAPVNNIFDLWRSTD